MTTQTERPEFVEDEHLEYLDELRESGETNMFGARAYLLREFPELSDEEAASILVYWMGTFGERHAMVIEDDPDTDDFRPHSAPDIDWA